MWRAETFKLSNDPRFEEKLVDAAGLYLDPPERAVVFFFDEKPGAGAGSHLTVLPMKRGRGQTLSHDYKRHGITDLLAALNVATGEVTVDFRDRHTGENVLRFFQQIDKTVPRDLEIHVVLEDLSAHKAPVVTSWLERPRKRRWHLHYTPTSSSWLNLPEGWFRELTQRRPRRGSFMSVEHLSDAITLGQPLEQRPQTLHLADPRQRDPRQSPTRPRHPKHQHPFRVRPLRDLLGRPSVPGAISDP